MQGQPIIQIAQNARGHQGQGDGQEPVAGGAEREEPDDDAHRRGDGQRGEQRPEALAHAEQGPRVQAGLKAEDPFPKPPASRPSGRTEPAEHPGLGGQVGRARAQHDGGKDDVAAERDRWFKAGYAAAEPARSRQGCLLYFSCSCCSAQRTQSVA